MKSKFFFNDTATTEIYTLSLHDALPISKPYDVPKNFKNSKEVENWEGTKNVRILHILCTLSNFLVFLHLDFSGTHSNTS